MEIKKNINKIIIKKIFEILFVIAFIFISIPFWSKLDNGASDIVDSYNNIIYTKLDIKENNMNYKMIPMSNDYAIKYVKDTVLTVSNDTFTPESYTLLLVIDKSSTLDFNLLNISVNDKINPLNTLDMQENQDNYIFALASDSIMGEVKNYNIKMWIDKNATDIVQGKNLELYFDIEKNTTTA